MTGAGIKPDTAEQPKVRVVRIIARLNVGGPAIHVTNLTAGLAERYPTLLVAGDVAEDEADLTSVARSRGVKLLRLPELGPRVRPWQDLIALVKLVRILRRVRPQLVHTHTAKAGALGRVAAILAGIPVRVHTFHGHVFRGYFGRAVSNLILITERLLGRYTTCVVTVSPNQAAELIREFRICPPEKIRSISLGFDFARFRQDGAEELGSGFRNEVGAAGRPVVSIVGRLVPIKNHSLFLEAAAALQARGRNCLFVIVGGGVEEGALRRKVEELGLSDSVRFLGWRQDVERIYAGSDIVALTSDNEGTPVCLIEALAAGRPVVATEVGGVGDVLEGGRIGRLVPRGDADGLVDCISELLDHPDEARELGRRGAKAIPARFGIARLLTEIEALYDELLERPDAPTA